MTTSQEMVARKLLSALAAATLAFLVLAVLPLAQRGVFTLKNPVKEYSKIELAPYKKTQDTSQSANGGFATNLEMPQHVAGANNAPKLSLPAGYGVAEISASAFANKDGFSSGNFASTGGRFGGADFDTKIFDFAQLDKIPRRIKSGKSEYPQNLYRSGTEGEVKLSLYINADGTVEVESVISSTHKDFEAAAIKAAESQIYEIPMRGEAAVRAKFELLIPFRISK